MTLSIANRPVYIDTDELSKFIRLKKNTIERKRSKGADLPPCYYVGRENPNDPKDRSGRVLYKLEEVIAWVESKRHVPSSVQLALSGKGAQR